MIAIEGPRPNGGWPVHVGGGGGVVAVQDLGGQVARSAEQPAGVGELGVVRDAGQAEVDQDRGTALEQHVGGLHVAVQHPGRVHTGQALGQATREPSQVVTLDRSLLRHVVVQAQPRHVARGDVRRGRPWVGVDDLGDPPAADALQRADLAGQPRPRLVVADDVRAQDLQGHARSAGLAGQVHHTHTTLAQPGEQLVVADGARG